MATIQMPLLTAEDYRNLPETGPRYQLVEGEIYMAPAPNRYHQEISRNLELILGQWLLENPIGKIYDAPFDVYLGEHDVFQPDILFVSKERYAILTDAGVEGVPDFVVEILSPKTAKLDRENKRKMYAHYGLEELWIIEPDRRGILAYRLQEDPTAPSEVFSEGDTIEPARFPGLKIDTRRVFAE